MKPLPIRHPARRQDGRRYRIYVGHGGRYCLMLAHYTVGYYDTLAEAMNDAAYGTGNHYADWIIDRILNNTNLDPVENHRRRAFGFDGTGELVTGGWVPNGNPKVYTPIGHTTWDEITARRDTGDPREKVLFPLVHQFPYSQTRLLGFTFEGQHYTVADDGSINPAP